jgi:hypothetical protein
VPTEATFKGFDHEVVKENFRIYLEAGLLNRVWLCFPFMPPRLIINWFLYGCLFPLLSPLLVALALVCLRRQLIAYGRLFCDGQLCFYAASIAVSTMGDLITEFGNGKRTDDIMIQFCIATMVWVFFISTFFFAVLTLAEHGNAETPRSIWVSTCLAAGATTLAGSIRWYYHLY